MSPMKAKLVSVESQSFEIPLDQLPLVIGRGPEANVRIRDPWLSRTQCEIQARDGQLVIRDLDSKHGTFINGAAVREANLMPNDLVCVGLTRFRLSCDAVATRDAQAAEAQLVS